VTIRIKILKTAVDWTVLQDGRIKNKRKILEGKDARPSTSSEAHGQVDRRGDQRCQKTARHLKIEEVRLSLYKRRGVFFVR
jgi:hypothetical protein